VCLCSLEQELLEWLLGLDLISTADVAAGFSSISSALSSGILLCEVATAVAAVPVVGVTERPLAAAARSSNISMAVEAVRHLPGICLG